MPTIDELRAYAASCDKAVEFAEQQAKEFEGTWQYGAALKLWQLAKENRDDAYGYVAQAEKDASG